MKVAELKAYEIFKNRFSEKEAEELLEYFEDRVVNGVEAKKDVLASKEDLWGVEKALREDMAKLEKSLREDITKGRVEAAENKSELLKWMFIFWTTQLLAIFAFLKIFIKP